MKMIIYHDIEMAHDFLVSVFGEVLTESSDIAFNDFFINKLPLHRKLLEHYKIVFNIMKTITDKLLENSNLNTKIDEKFINLLSATTFSVCVLEEGIYIKQSKIRKEDIEKEIKILLEELKLCGVGNGVVKNLSKIYQSIFHMSHILFKSKDIFASFNEHNLTKSLVIYIRNNKLSLNNFIDSFSNLENTIAKMYSVDLVGKFKSSNSKVFRIDEFNL